MAGPRGDSRGPSRKHTATCAAAEGAPEAPQGTAERRERGGCGAGRPRPPGTPPGVTPGFALPSRHLAAALSLHPTRRTPPRPTRPRARKEGGAGERERESSLAPPARLLSELCEAPGRRPPSPLANSSTLLLKVSLQGNSSRWRAQAHHRTCRHAGVRILVNASVALHTASQGPSAEPVSFSLPRGGRKHETRARPEKLATRHSCLE